MLTPLKRKGTPAKEPDVVDLLLECHDRIRRFTRLAAWLSHATDGQALAVEETANSVLRYFVEALPRHSEDEEKSIAPRLKAKQLNEELSSALDSMVRQHDTIEEALAILLPMWRNVASDPAALNKSFNGSERTLSQEMERRVDSLKGLWDVHLHLEETIVFPTIRAHLSEKEREAILNEMRERRSATAGDH